MNNTPNIMSVLRRAPQAAATIRGSSAYPEIYGNARFYKLYPGTLVFVQTSGLPTGENACNEPVFGMHIHSGAYCRGNARDPFAEALTHYNPNGCPHPYHAGDLPPLFGAGGNALSVFLTDRFDVDEIIGKTLIIHSAPDDFTTQPGGNSGEKIACGEIVSLRV